ncbi:MAG: PPC domain-containing protein [Kofleriaceae bacterium]
MKPLSSLLASVALATTALPSCTDDSSDLYDGEAVKSEDGKADASALAVFVDFEFSGKLVTNYSFNSQQTIESQLLYTVGQLNGAVAVGRIDSAVLSNIQRTYLPGGKLQISYNAKLPVAWGRRASVPATFDLKLPLDVSSVGKTAFANKYWAKCVDFTAHGLDAGAMFYHFRPQNTGCVLDAADIVTTTATVTPSPVQTTGKFPEYDKVWEDGVFNVVAMFGKYNDGALANDPGITAYDEFVRQVKLELAELPTTTIPASIPTGPGVAYPDLEFNATLPDGKKLRIVAMLTDDVSTGLMQPEFRARYNALSSRADLIAYNGHAGLGSHVQALAKAGAWVTGQYVVVYMNGCDTFAYIDDALFTAHKQINSDDTTGYKYIDIVNNAMPADFASMPQATMAMIRGLLDFNAPRTYEQLFNNIDRVQIALVVGEQDNLYTPGPSGPVEAWDGVNVHEAIAKNQEKRWSTPIIEAGRYQFAMTGTNDADLYVRVGSEPTLAKFDCRPYKVGSNETCEINLARPGKIFVMARGYSPLGSGIDLIGKKL